MENRVHLYVSRQNFFTRLASVLLMYSLVARVVVFGFTKHAGTVGFWGQIVLPMAATLLYLFIILADGEECFYKTTIPVGMMALYGGICILHVIQSRLYISLFFIALMFLTLVYGEITSGVRKQMVWCLPCILLNTLVIVLYNNRPVVLGKSWDGLVRIHADLICIIACFLLSFAIRSHPVGQYHRRWGDRSDGRRLRSLAPMDQVSPYIMVNRNGSTNSFEESFEITNADRYIRQKRREGLIGFSIMHVFLACYCRTLAKYPGLNRFIAGQKVYSRGDDIQFCLTIKKEMSTTAPETIIKVHLNPRDTAADVYRKVNTALAEAKEAPLDSSFDNTARALMMVPGVFLKFLVWLLKFLDYFGLLPKFLLEISPFHGSIFFTSMGSLGIPPIYHHLYDFGNLPVFGAFGCKRRAIEVQEDGTLVQKKYVDFRFTLDERIVDGFYYATFFKHFRRLVMHPELLDTPPEEVQDDID